MATKKKKSNVKKKVIVKKVTARKSNKRFLVVLGAVLAVFLVLLATLVISQSKFEGNSPATVIQVHSGY